MLTVYNCIVNQHNLWLVLLAGTICLIASINAVSLLRHTRQAKNLMRLSWIAICGTSFGFGIWATHFVAMLAFSPNVPSAYDVPLTLASLLIAVAASALGFGTATSGTTRDHHLVGGAITGAGIAAMHYTGMAAFEVQGRLVWDERFIAASLVLGVTLGAIATHTVLRKSNHRGRSTIIGALTFTLAICSMHFTGMGAVSIIPDGSIEISPSSIPAEWLAGGVAAAAFTILALTAVAVWLDIRDARRVQMEENRMRGLANAAVEGLLVCDGTQIVTANNAFSTLSGRDDNALLGQDYTSLFGEMTQVAEADEGQEPIYETLLNHADGSKRPVEIILRSIDYFGRPHRAVAVRDIRERKAAEDNIRKLAMNDTLTGLPNRRSFNARLKTEMDATPEGQSVAVLCMDLDRFKEVNDLFGHAAGDAMLCKVAKCVESVLEDTHLVARLGGDEFAIIAPGIATPNDAGRLAEKILEAFREANRSATSEGLMSTSIGIALYPQDATDQETLVNYADTALYRAKSEGRDTYRLYDHEMGQEARARRIMEHELRHAVSRKEFSLVYQPQKKLDSGETIGYEALLRWTHPERGNVSPGIFIPVAEESGAIVQIGEWVLQEACRTAAKWNEALTVAVNVSPVQLHSPHFALTVHQILLNTGLAPQRLELEITETALVRDMHRALATLRQLKGIGVRVAMDDFGTGYSSLSNLRAFPFDKIKIDGSFIRQVDTNQQAATIVKAVLGIGRGLGLPVLAEGVETSGELKFLADEFCQIGQGYYLGRPATLENIEKEVAA